MDQSFDIAQDLDLLADFVFDAAACPVLRLGSVGEFFQFTGEGVGGRELKLYR
jgi:hypothetical protein